MKTEVRRILEHITASLGGFVVPVELHDALRSQKVILGSPVVIPHADDLKGLNHVVMAFDDCEVYPP